MEPTSEQLTSTNFRDEMKKVFQPYKEKIVEASNHFNQNYQAYKRTQQQKKSILFEVPNALTHHNSPSLISEYSQQQQVEHNPTVNVTEEFIARPANLCEWESSKLNYFDHSQQIHKFYHEVFSKKKFLRKNERSFYDFKKDEKQILVKVFNELKGKDNYVTFKRIVQFFSSCKLYYLCYNIKPSELMGILKDSAHQVQDRLSLSQFLNIFYIDRPNITGYEPQEGLKINKRCVLTAENWKDLKSIFSTLDTFGDETIYLGPFIYKVKNNLSNMALINEPAVEYPEINRTISVKKVIFNIEYRSVMEEKIRWKDIESIFNNYEHKNEPTIDNLYKKMIERGEISKFTNNFMLHSSILDQIKNIFYRCPKYCDHFVKTKFICKQLLQSKFLKSKLRQAVVRTIMVGVKPKVIKLQDQIRQILQETEDYIDLDELLQNFSIRGPINSTPDKVCQIQAEESDQEDELRIREIEKARSLEKCHNLFKNKSKYKPLRHLTVCQEFNLSQKTGESTMEKKTRLMKEESDQMVENEYKKKFKANPIPAEINQQRYNEFIKEMQEQKQLKRQQFAKRRQEENRVYQYLKTNTLLFSKKQIPVQPQIKQPYHFTPKSIPWFVGQIYMLDKINEQKKLRRKALNIQCKKKMLKYWKDLPDAVRSSEQYSEDYIHSVIEEQNQKQKPSNKTKEIPNFKELQKEFAESLEKRKKQWKATKPVQFNLSYHHSQPKRKESDTKRKSESLRNKRSVPVFNRNAKIDIPSTVKHQQMVSYTRDKLTQKLIDKEKQLKEEKLRLQKQHNFAKFMRKKLNQNIKKSKSLHNITTNKYKSERPNFKKYQKQNQEDLCRIYVNVMSRPFLFENNFSSIKSSKQSGTNAVVSLKKKAKNKCSHQTSKHIHQSPLKAIEQYDDTTEKKGVSPYCDQYDEDESPYPHVNQSF